MASKTKRNSITGARLVREAAKALNKDLPAFFTEAAKGLKKKAEQDEWMNPHVVSIAVGSFEQFCANHTQGIVEEEPNYSVPAHVLKLAKRVHAGRELVKRHREKHGKPNNGNRSTQCSTFRTT